MITCRATEMGQVLIRRWYATKQGDEDDATGAIRLFYQAEYAPAPFRTTPAQSAHLESSSDDQDKGKDVGVEHAFKDVVLVPYFA